MRSSNRNGTQGFLIGGVALPPEWLVVEGQATEFGWTGVPDFNWRKLKCEIGKFGIAGMLLAPACALAQATSNTMTSGRPSAVLDDAQCQTVWKMASPDGATISQGQAVPFIVNFQMVDVDGDGKITADEFKAACGKGLVKNTKP